MGDRLKNNLKKTNPYKLFIWTYMHHHVMPISVANSHDPNSAIWNKSFNRAWRRFKMIILPSDKVITTKPCNTNTRGFHMIYAFLHNKQDVGKLDKRCTLNSYFQVRPENGSRETPKTWSFFFISLFLHSK